MSFSTIAQLVSGQRPVWLYELTFAGETVFYTSRLKSYVTPAGKPASDFTGSTVWQGRPVSHSKIRRADSNLRLATEIGLPNSDSFARQFLDDAGTLESLVRIWQGFENDPDDEYQIKFRGRVVATKRAFASVVLLAESGETVTRRKGIPALLQRPCRHPLYFGGCKLSYNAWKVGATASALTNSTVTVAAAANKPDGWYNGGILEYKGQMQTIRKHVGTSLQMLSGIPKLTADIAAGPLVVTIAPGCDRTINTCRDKFDNLLNHGGLDKLSETPFDGRSIR